MMFNRKQKFICMICHDEVKVPCFLNLTCDCIYECHFKCFNEWYNIKHECIICHKSTYGRPNWRKIKNRKYKRHKTPYRRHTTTNEIERRLALIPDDNDNERKTLKFIVGFFVFMWIIYNYLK